MPFRRTRNSDVPVFDATTAVIPAAVRATTPASPTAQRVRLESVDVLRGIIMILMALDHVRDFFGDVAADPTNIATTTVPLFFTRWITHFCAPVFFLLTGVGAFLASRRRTQAELSQFLLARGLWLVFLEIVVARCFAWQFNIDYRVTMLTVLWAIGWSLVLLAALSYLPVRVVGIGAVLTIAGHNLLDPLPPKAFGPLAPLWSVLHSPGVVYSDGTHLVFAAYVLIPWVAVVAAGYALGQIFMWEPARRQNALLRLGSALTFGFLILRGVNIYGDARPWVHAPTGLFTVLSFLNASKYPPSLLFLMMTLGPALLFVRAVDGRTPAFLRPAVVFGRVPLFYFVVHAFAIHALAVGVCYWRFGAVHWMFESPGLAQYPVTQPPGWPSPLPIVYLIWVAVVLMLYPLCRWFARVKQQRNDWWLSYL
jgi:uncharacterized membrane protein